MPCSNPAERAAVLVPEIWSGGDDSGIPAKRAFNYLL